jgi:hypothetical protein
VGARLVLAVAEGADLLGAAVSARAGDAPASGAAIMAFGAALVHVASLAQARSTLASIPHLPVVPGDDRAVRAAVALVSQGVLPVDVLPPDGVVELFVVTGPTTAHPSVAVDDAALDRRHRYLALALTQPGSPLVRELAGRLHAVSPTDPVVAAATAIAQLAEGGPIAPDAPRILLARNPADPLLAAVALRLAEKTGDADVARRARETLSALGASRRAVD